MLRQSVAAAVVAEVAAAEVINETTDRSKLKWKRKTVLVTTTDTKAELDAARRSRRVATAAMHSDALKTPKSNLRPLSSLLPKPQLMPLLRLLMLLPPSRKKTRV